MLNFILEFIFVENHKKYKLQNKKLKIMRKGDFMDFLILFFIFIIIFQIKYSKELMFEYYLSKDATQSLKAISAIIVLFSHISQRTDGGVIFPYLVKTGNLAVAIFFFISGYGLIIQFINKKEAYLNNFLKLRLLKIIVPYIVANLVFLVVVNCIGIKTTIWDIVIGFFDGNLVLPFSWYVILIIILYILFYIIAKNSKTYLRLLTYMLISQLVICSILYFRDYGIWWYSSCLTFTLGICWGVYKESINKIIKSRYYLLEMVIFTFFILSFFSTKILSIIGIKDISTIFIAIFNQISSILFCIFIVMLLLKFKIKNKILSFLSKISFEVYLFQGVMMTILRNDFWNFEGDVMYSIIVIIMTIILAFIFNNINNKLLANNRAKSSH